MLFSKNIMIYLFGFAAIFFAPFYFLLLPETQISNPAFMPIAVFIEIVVYFAFVIMSYKGIQLGIVVILSFLLMFIRLALCFVAAVLTSFIKADELVALFMQIWVSNPLSMIVQIFLLILFVPYLIENLMPGISLLGGGVADVDIASGRVALTTSSYEEVMSIKNFSDLSLYLKRFPDVSGYILYNKEGLALWADLPEDITIDKDKLAAKISDIDNKICSSLKEFEITPANDIFLGTKEYKLFLTKPNELFGMILFSTKDTLFQKFYNKLDMIKKSTDFFLREKYRNLFDKGE